MSMRVAWALLPVLLACRPAHDPRRIQDALARTPIDVAALEEAFHVEPNALAIRAGPIPAVTPRAPDEPWALENVSSRPVWVRRSWLTVEATHTPFLTPSVYVGSRLGGRRVTAIPRPSFDPAAWVLLYPGERTGLAFKSKRWEPGEHVLRAFVGDAGAWLVHAAREFNENRRLPFKGGAPVATLTAATLLLPPADWPGAPWHDTHPIDPLPLGEGRFELILGEPPEDLFALPLEAFVIDPAGTCVGRGDLKVLSVVDDDSPSRRAVYGLPFALPPGDYRLLVRAPDVAGYFLVGAAHACDAPDDAASRWIPFRVE